MKRISFWHTFLTAGLILLPLAPGFLPDFEPCAEPAQGGIDPEKLHSIIPRDAKPVLVIDGTGDNPALTFTEGPTWMNGSLYFSNIHWKAKRGTPGLHVLRPDGSCIPLNGEVMTEGSMPLPNGNLVVCDMGGRRVIEMTPLGGIVRTLADSCEGLPIGAPNDLITDMKGGIYFTQPDRTHEAGNAVYYIRPDGTVVRVTGRNEFTNPNGCVLSGDGSLFFLGDYSETTIHVFDVGADGTLSNKRLFANVLLPEGGVTVTKRPMSNADGMTIDRKGNIYIATRMGIQVFDSSGALIGVIVFPKQPAHCVFGGEDISVLYALCEDQIYTIQTTMQGLRYP